MKLFDYKQMNDVYYSFHTQDPEWGTVKYYSPIFIKNLYISTVSPLFAIKKQ